MEPYGIIIIAMIITFIGAAIKYFTDMDIIPFFTYFTILSFFIPAMIAIFSYVNAPTHEMETSLNFIDSFFNSFGEWFPGFILGDVGATLASTILDKLGISY